MATISFQQIRFQKASDHVKATFLTFYEFHIPKEKLDHIGPYEVAPHNITFHKTTQTRAQRKFQLLLEEGFTHLTHKITKRPTYYIHKNSGIPLMGTLYFGIVDKGSSMIELKPMTGCNMNCVFCSVDEGIDSKRQNDYLIEREYIVAETKKLLTYKKQDTDLYINPHGEPLLYPELVDLCKDLSKLKFTKNIILITAGTLLTKPLIDELAKCNKVKLNVSVHAFDQKKAQELFGTKTHNAKHIRNMLSYASSKMPIIIAPVLVKGENESEMSKIIDFAQEIKAKVYIQKFLKNKHGRNLVKEESWHSFMNKLKSIEKETGYSLTEPLPKMVTTQEYPSPFKSRQIIDADVVLPGRFPNERMCVSSNRIISVLKCNKQIGTKIRVRLLRTKNNILRGECIA